MDSDDQSQERLLNTLDTAESFMLTVYRAILVLLAVALVAVVAFVVVKRPWGAGNQGEWFYFGVAVLFATCWLVAQFIGVRRRRRRASGALLRSAGEGGNRSWTFRFGSPPPAGDELNPDRGERTLQFSRQFSMPLGTIPLASITLDKLPDEDALSRIAALVSSGCELAEAVRHNHPGFKDLGDLEQEAVLLYVRHKLEGR